MRLRRPSLPLLEQLLLELSFESEEDDKEERDDDDDDDDDDESFFFFFFLKRFSFILSGDKNSPKISQRKYLTKVIEEQHNHTRAHTKMFATISTTLRRTSRNLFVARTSFSFSSTTKRTVLEKDEKDEKVFPYLRFVRENCLAFPSSSSSSKVGGDNVSGDDGISDGGNTNDGLISRLVKTLDALKYALISPETKVGMFPLMMPIGISPDDGNAIGFLLEPSFLAAKENIHIGAIVKARANQRQIEFVAKDATTFIRRALLEEEVNALKRGGLMPVRDSILRSSSSSSGLSSSNAEHAEHDRETLARLAASKHVLNAYTTQNIGSFPDVIESLISRHEFVKKDETSALVACEFYINREEFTNKWARPYAINARTLRRYENRESEARDAARIALSVAPWFTLGGGYGESGVSGSTTSRNSSSIGGSGDEDAILPPLTGATLEDMKKLVNMENMDAKSAKNMLEGVGTEIAKEHEKNVPEMSEEAKALKRCFDVLDYASWGNEEGYESWDNIREELSESYEKAGMKRFAEIVKPSGGVMN